MGRLWRGHVGLQSRTEEQTARHPEHDVVLWDQVPVVRCTSEKTSTTLGLYLSRPVAMPGSNACLQQRGQPC
jgi:hypothetical protein